MIEVRLKDKLFVVLAVPAAVAGLYLSTWRPENAKRLDDLRGRDRRTVSVDAFPGEKMRKSRALADAVAGLERERSAPPPAGEVKGDKSDSPARRTQATVEVFRAAGLRVVSSEVSAPASAAEGRPSAAETLRATAVRPEPVSRVYLLEGDFPRLRRALGMFEENKSAVVVGSLTAEGGNRWRVTVDE